jgi:glycosyltransferase involved in cell wall biosynthesis
LRILILNYEYPPLGGGAGIVTKHLAERFAAKGHQVHVVTTWFPGEPEFVSEGNLSIMRLPSKRRHTYKSNPIEMLSWAKQALRYFRQLPEEKLFDVCLANFTMPGGLVARYIKKKWDIPYVILSHGHDIPWFAPKQMFIWHLFCYPWIKSITRQAARTILLTPELKETADRFTGKAEATKNVVIPNGMLMDHFRTGFDGSEETLQVLFVGRMVDQKDPVTFVKACKLLNRMRVPVHFTMIGDGPLKENVEKLILKQGIRNIEVMGQLSHYNVLKTYEKAHVLVLPSREEAMSMVILEAVSRGIYTITTNVSGNSEVIREDINGDFVNYGDAAAIAQKIAAFYYEKYSNGYQYPEQMVNYLFDRYSWDNVVNEYLDIFHCITGVEKKIDISR